jgi:translation initiation factor 5B
LCVVKTEIDHTTKPPTTTKTIIDIGRVTSIEKNHEVFQKLTKKNIGAGAAIKVEAIINQPKLQVGRHFEETDELYSHITRNSIDVMKEHFRAEAEPSDWALIKKLKPLLDIA